MKSPIEVGGAQQTFMKRKFCGMIKKPLFATSINCMDGRIQLPIIKFIKKKCRVKYVDIITEAGVIKYLSTENCPPVIKSIKQRVKVSVEKHNSKIIAVSGHYDCAGNPVSKEKQMKQIGEAAKTLKRWGYNVKILKLWIDKDWKVRMIE